MIENKELMKIFGPGRDKVAMNWRKLQHGNLTI
jgi:hypothetical protein